MIKYTLTLIAALTLFLTGCASAPRVARMEPMPSPGMAGIYHSVIRGETLWCIAKSYNVEIGKIVNANRLSDPSKIEIGQMLFIPGAKTQLGISDKILSDKISDSGFILPAKGKVISYYGQKRHNTINNGIDILSEEGIVIVASKDGVVTFCDDKVKGFGKTIIIDHDNGFSTVYAYNLENLIKAGDRVKRGQVIGRVGKNSRSKEYMLHFEIRKKQKPVNPFYYLP